MTRLTFHGATRTVTGSMHLIETDSRKILLDCGLYQGRREEAFKRNRHFPFDPAEITDVVLSHAHIDHSGNLPTLYRKGFRGRIHATHATRDLCAVMLMDSAYIQEKEIEFVNKRRERKGLEPFNPLYTKKEAQSAIELFTGYSYHQQFKLDGAEVAFQDAGHILGSAVVKVRTGGGTIGYSGDIGRKDLPILRDPEPLGDVDWLICESTYGNRLHGPAAEVEEKVAQIVNRTYKARGKVIIPAFSVGRTQQIVYTLHRLADEDRIPPLPIYVDSPLSTNVTDVFRAHPECYDDETLDYFADSKDPFGFHRLEYVRSVEESMALNGRRDPMVIISASGMAETGRILHHLRNNIEDSRNTVLIVGFQAEHTLGRRLVEKAEEVRIFGEWHTRRANVEVINAFSAHADRDEITEWFRPSAEDVRQVFLVHGNEEASFALADHWKDVTSARIDVPEDGQSFELR